MYENRKHNYRALHKLKGGKMKIGTLCKVITKHSHSPSQFGDLIVITARSHGIVVCGTNLKTGNKHHYYPKELEEVKK